MVNVMLDAPGLAGSESDSYVGPVSPLAGDTPPVVTIYVNVPENSDFAIYEVANLDAVSEGGELAAALIGEVDPNDDLLARCILATKVVTGAGETTTVPVYIQGCFRPDMLVWPASYDTDAKKLAAFNEAPSPVNIVLKEVPYGPQYA